MTLRCKKTEVS